ncbi:MAG TPA: class I SAM-dependent methyltransferase [Acidimicrobiales bacterium]|nr:class I SAM-dependent methyltransferase [Acidimicrobiales bacterium]
MAERSDSRRRAFAAIYEQHDWLGGSKSGPGSDPERTAPYRAIVERFLREHAVRRVLDIGCGDWSTSGLIDWSAVDYTGVDVVGEVVDANQARHAGPGISFRRLDAVDDDLPDADLVLIKEVLQHLPTDDVLALLAKVAQYPYVIVVNDIAHRWRRRWFGRDRWHPMPPTNTDVEPGGYRLLDLRQPPFGVVATSLGTYRNRFEGAQWVKEVLLLQAAGVTQVQR